MNAHQAARRWPPAFSDDVVDAARALLERRGVLLIVGAPGSNRHRLGRAVAETADGVVWQHACRHDDGERAGRTVARLLAALGGDPSTPPEQVASTLAELVRAQEGPCPVLLLGDAGFADEESIDVLADLAVARDLLIVLAVTPEAVAAVPRLAAMSERVDLDPLDRTTIERLLRARLGAIPHDVLVGFVEERSQGSYGSLCDIGDLLDEAGALVRAEGVVMVDPERLEAFRLALPHRRRPLSAERLGGRPETVTLVDLVALIGEVDATEASACLDPAVIAFAVRHGALRRRDGVLTMLDALEAEAVVAAMSAARMSELWHAYADRLEISIHRPESVIRTVRWCSASGVSVGPRLARLAAREANRRGLYRRTVEFTAPGRTTADPLTTQQERAHALIQVGDLDGLRALLATLDPAQVPEDELLHLMRWATRIVTEEERQLLRERAVGPHHDAPTRRRRTIVVELAELYTDAFSETSPEMIRTVRSRTLSGDLSPVNEALAHAVLAALLRHAGRLAEAVHSGRIAVAMLESPEIDASAALIDPVREILFMAHLSAMQLDDGQDLLDRYQAHCVRYGLGGRLGLLMAGLLALMRGRPDMALANAQLFLTRSAESDALRFRGWVEAVAAHVLAVLGRHEEASALLASSEAHPVHQRRQNDLDRRLAQALAHDALADPERALEILEDLADEAHQHGLLTIEVDALGVAVLIDGPRIGPRLLAAVDDVVDPTGTPAVWQAFARAVVAYDFAALSELAHRLAAEGHPRFAGRVAQFALDAGRRATDLDDAARASLTELAP
ncbi:hypothetical protein [Aeromicrobium stalagmiti]|uniref:hypothetical protein n=1 Tax=Aeromicrobium stalagmiti TaxID=2738988 RepID=UPI0015680D82|nr:hypothetical protein [Aeromicrobium stalagmiti]NRQ49435.1 hypothetical protein [Aeromicrobium stalagmiti]